jgi:hypothetical protein
MDDPPIPREGTLKGWKLPRGVEKPGNPETPDACPFCGTSVEPVGRLGQGTFGDTGPEPWQETAECPKCGAGLRRTPGEPWIGAAA